jgi:hypothetical protein
MLGFELTIKGKIISAGVENGVVSLIATRVINESIDSINLDLTGLSLLDDVDNCAKTINWHSSELKLGDEISIKVIDIVDCSQPQSIIEKKTDSLIEQKLKSYKALKKELENKGLI